MNTEKQSMTMELAFESMEKILPHLAEVLNDAEIKDLTEKVKQGNEKMLAGDAMLELLPLFVGKHKEAMFNIIAIFRGVTVEEARQMDFREAIKVMRDNFLGDMLVFFICCLRMVSVR